MTGEARRQPNFGGRPWKDVTLLWRATMNLIIILHVTIMREENMVVEIFHVTKLPLFMLRLLLFLSSSLHMLLFACLDNLLAHKMPMHRKYVRLICVPHML